MGGIRLVRPDTKENGGNCTGREPSDPGGSIFFMVTPGTIEGIALHKCAQ